MASDQLERNTRTNAVFTLLSRMTGLVRDGAISRIFGSGVFASAFYFAFLIPNLFRRLFGEGALAAAFLPEYSKLHHKNPNAAKALATLTLSSLIIVLGAFTVAGELVMLSILSMQSDPSPSLQLAMIMLPYMPLVCVVAILAAMLHVHGRFGPPAAAPIILNGLMILATLGFVGFFKNPLQHMMFIGVSVVVAGVIQVAWSLLALRNIKWHSKETRTARKEMRSMIRRTVPMIIGLATLQLNTLFDGIIASWPTVFGSNIAGVAYPLGEGAMSSLSWAQRLYQFPLGVFGIAVATAIYPLLATQMDDKAAFSSTIRRGLRLVVFVGLPASIGLILVRNPLAAAVFQGGQFTSEDTTVVGSILLGYASAVWAYSMVHVLTKGYYAIHKEMVAVKIAVICVCLNLILNMVLIWTPLKTAGLAWSTAICAVIQVGLLLICIRKHTDNVVDKQVIYSWLQTILVTLVMGGIVWYIMDKLWFEAGTWEDSLVTLCATVASGLITVLACSYFLKMRELWWALGKSK